jgi:hypothetical protein
MSSPELILPVVVAVVLIVYGRVHHRDRWGNRIAIAGYAVLAITAVFAFVLRG